MISVPWSKYVLLKRPNTPTSGVAVATTKEAAYFLLSRWPEEKGESYKRAVRTCAAAIRGEVSDRAAQAAFVVAAMYASFFIELRNLYSDPFEEEIAEVSAEILSEERRAR